MSRKRGSFDQRELATILAALSNWRALLHTGKAEWRDDYHIATNGREFAALNEKEIDKLCERLNQ